MKNSNFTCLNEIGVPCEVWWVVWGKQTECLFVRKHISLSRSLKTKSRHWFQKKIMRLIVRENCRIEAINMQFKFNFFFFFITFVCNPIINMDSIVMYYHEKCMRKCSPLGSCPVVVGRQAKPRNALCSLSFSLIAPSLTSLNIF